jgi:hypothetical protein
MKYLYDFAIRHSLRGLSWFFHVTVECVWEVPPLGTALLTSQNPLPRFPRSNRSMEQGATNSQLHMDSIGTASLWQL